MNFKNTIIILTSNLGAEHLQKAALDSSTSKCLYSASELFWYKLIFLIDIRSHVVSDLALRYVTYKLSLFCSIKLSMKVT